MTGGEWQKSAGSSREGNVGELQAMAGKGRNCQGEAGNWGNGEDPQGLEGNDSSREWKGREGNSLPYDGEETARRLWLLHTYTPNPTTTTTHHLPSPSHLYFIFYSLQNLAELKPTFPCMVLQFIITLLGIITSSSRTGLRWSWEGSCGRSGNHNSGARCFSFVHVTLVQEITPLCWISLCCWCCDIPWRGVSWNGFYLDTLFIFSPQMLSQMSCLNTKLILQQ